MFRALNKDKCGVLQQQPMYPQRQQRMVDPMFKASQSYVPSPPQVPRRTWSDTFRGMFGRKNNNYVNTTVRDDEYNIAGGKKKKIRSTKRKSGGRERRTRRRM
jgi:hypothetical protein